MRFLLLRSPEFCKSPSAHSRRTYLLLSALPPAAPRTTTTRYQPQQQRLFIACGLLHWEDIVVL
eukprot:scaffold11552_cov76-Skeletonema_dohrnii-CCMP3373.AAC.1